MTNNKNNNQSVNNSVNNDELFEHYREPVFIPVFDENLNQIEGEFIKVYKDEEELTDEQKVELYGFCW